MPDNFKIHVAKRSLSQNFLIDGNISRKIVQALDIHDGDVIVEIGPGKGALTGILAEAPVKVFAVEKDDYLSSQLREQFAYNQEINIINNDFLEFKLPEVSRKVKVIGNIPYNLTAKIISYIVDNRSLIKTAVIMVQSEVANRLIAHEGTKAYGALSVRLQLTSSVKKLFDVSRSCFRPSPGVDSSVLSIMFEKQIDIQDEEKFAKFVKGAFSMRRKMIRHFVSHKYGRTKLELLPDKINTKRIEELSPREIYDLFLILERPSSH
ncbi:MAG: 16S rRNA (adenine(1518)-N(6)/adenine(1519)-N(6))-dimethyltransferase RsmA [Candidatus Kryptoniota bacterium]